MHNLAEDLHFSGRPKRRPPYALKHGERYSRLGAPSREYICWAKMISRCESLNDNGYAEYGGRGISVCRRWRDSFEAFLEDMGRKPTTAHSIDRIDNNGDYEPGNCRWATRTQQGRNKRNNHIVICRGTPMPVSQAAEILGIKRGTIIWRANRGLPLDAPVRGGGGR